MTTIEALFVPKPDGTYLPTQTAVGAWDPESLHGAAIAALLAGRLAAPHRTLARITIDLLASTPNAALTLDISEAEGGRRAQRRQAVLSCNGRPVAIARALTIATADLDLPPSWGENASPFDPDEAPNLTTPHRSLARTIGWENFHSLAVATSPLRVVGAAPGSHQWTSLTLPVVADSEVTGTEITAVAPASAALRRVRPPRPIRLHAHHRATTRPTVRSRQQTFTTCRGGGE
jgi:hypothetical protein